ncbi:MAG: sigma-70 family RNA polymerase sigma factor [Candidatus Rokuibacteriota bacterium]
MVRRDLAETDQERANQLAVSHLYLVQHIVNQTSSRFPRHIDRQELWNAGAYGLVDASRRYDAASGIPFARYASIRIRGAIIDSTRSRDWASRGLRRDLREVKQATEAFETSHGRQPSNDELARNLGITMDKLEARRTAASRSTLLHLDQPLAGEQEESTLGERLPDTSPEHLPEEAIEGRELVGTLRTAIGFLPESQREVVERYYLEGQLLKDIADSMQVTEARVSQIRGEALNAMRAYFATVFDGVEDVDDNAPGRRRRAAFVAAMSSHSSWLTRLQAAEAAPAAPQPAVNPWVAHSA